MKCGVVLALLCAVLAVSVEARLKRRKESSEEVDDKVWNFAVGEADHGAYQYHDSEGRAKGFNIDLMFAVCEHAGKECYFTLDKATNCWYNEKGHEYPGIGLLAGWYDGCLGLFPTEERQNSFDFSKPYTKNMKVALYYRPESGLMDPEDDHELAGHKIGFVQGWATSQACLDHKTGYHGNHIGEYTPIMFEDFATMIEALMHDEVDAIMAPRALELDQKGFAHTEPYMYCTTQGASVMARYGNDVLNWWDKAFNEMLENGEFDELCEKEKTKHGEQGQLFCVEH